MSSFYHRATPRQKMILRMVEGAVRNTAHAHPDWKIPDRLAKSIAKRAAGTITSGWRDVLAAPVPSVGRDHYQGIGPAGRAQLLSAAKGDSQRPAVAGAGRVYASHAPLRRFHNLVGVLAGQARRSGKVERHEALVEVLRMISREMER